MIATPQAIPPKPAPMRVIEANIPDCLKSLNRWVTWEWTWNGRKWDKPPISPATRKLASSTDPSTWVSFSEAFAAYEDGRCDGIGFTFGHDEESGVTFSGFDFDGCRNSESGEIEPWAIHLIRLLDSYSEISPSGEGLKVFTSGELPKGKRADHDKGIECYDSGRYFTVTGNRLDGTPADVHERTEALKIVHQHTLGAPRNKCDAKTGDLSDRELALSALNGLSASRASGYMDWLSVGMALHSVDESLMGEWDKWSRTCPEKYQDGVCARKWQSFSNVNSNGIGVGSLVFLAKQDGWKPPTRNRKHGHDRTPTNHGNGKVLSMSVSTKWKPFPVEALPEPISRFVATAAKAIGCDPSYIALPTLAALAGAVGNTRRIELKRGWTEPAVIWAGNVGESGTLKSPAQDAPLKPIRERQAEAIKAHVEAMKRYEGECAAFAADFGEWKRKGRKAGEPLPEAPDKPVCERFWCGDITVEALAERLSNAKRGLLLIRDELSGWMRGFDQYRGGKGGDTAHWLAMHGARDLLVDRKTGDKTTIYVRHAAVSVIGGIQPETLRRALAREHFEDGLAARLLVAMPPRVPKRWTEAAISSDIETALSHVFDRLWSLQPGTDRNGEPYPQNLELSPEGKRAWIEFYNRHAGEQAELIGDLAAAWSKLEGYAARFALIVHCVRWADEDPKLESPDTIDAESVSAGVALSRWFGQEARRVYAALSESDEAGEQRQLVDLMRLRGGSLSVRELMRSNSAYKTADEAEQALGVLVQTGLAVRRTIPPGEKGGQPQQVFTLTDTIDTDRTSPNPKDCEVVSSSTAGSGRNGG